MRAPAVRGLGAGLRVEDAQGEHAVIAAELLGVDPPSGGRVPNLYLPPGSYHGAALVINQVVPNPLRGGLLLRPAAVPVARGVFGELLDELRLKAPDAAGQKQLAREGGQRAA